MIPKLTDAKLIRVDKAKETVLVWYGGATIQAFTLRGRKLAEYGVPNPAKPNFPTYTQVKHVMRSLIRDDKTQ